MSFSPVAGLVQTMAWPTALASISFSTFVKVRENELSFFPEKRILSEKNLGSIIVRGNKTNNRPSLSIHVPRRISIICGMSKNRIGCRLYILLRNRRNRIFEKDYKRILFINAVSFPRSFIEFYRFFSCCPEKD